MNSTDPIICDLGTSAIKVGFSSQKVPNLVLPIVGTPKVQNVVGCYSIKSHYVCEEAWNRRGVLRLSHAIERGIVTNWDTMERVWGHIFGSLKNSESLHSLVLTESPTNPKPYRERMAEMMFETFSAPALYVGTSAVFSLLASGHTAGVVLDCGAGVTHSVPVYEGYSLPHAVCRADMAGGDFTDFMVRLLLESGYHFTTSWERDLVRRIKEQNCYVASDFEQAFKDKDEVQIELPDGNIVQLGKQTFRCPEALFRPGMLGLQAHGIHEMVYQSVKRCDADIRHELFSNILLSGGSTLFKGLPERLTREVSNYLPASVQPRVIAPPARKYTAWIGASIFSSILAASPRMWITKVEYDEAGAGIVHQKCF